MMSIFLIAVMLDRPALTMRNVALAALAILIAAPESLFDPSFEMSFAAVIALVALYEWMSTRRGSGISEASPLFRGLRKGGSLIAAGAVTTLVAGTAIAPFAVYHFHRMTHYGLVANLVAAPLVSLLIMPMALLSLIAMPFGLETLPLKAMGLGIELMVATGKEVASWPGAVSILPQISGLALVLIVLGGVWLCLWQTRLRTLGLVITAAGLALAPQSERPDVLIERGGATAALRSESGGLVFPPATAAGYSADNWLLADGDARNVAQAIAESSFSCDSLGCIGKVKGKIVALIRDPGALEEDCRLAQIVIAPFSIGKQCRAARVVVDRRMLKAQGAHALYIQGLSIRTETVAAARGKRPWVRDPTVVTTEMSFSPEKDASESAGFFDPEN
jgi:competence protein ComEC